MVKLTKAQRKALFAVFKRDFPSWETPFTRVTHKGQGNLVSVSSTQYRRFRATVKPYFDKSGCVMVPWKGMWLGIETDGYTHS
jgi:ketosteroid isomerase-like protein